MSTTLRVFSKRNSQKPKTTTETQPLDVRRKSETNTDQVEATGPRSPLQSKLSQELGKVLQKPGMRDSGKIELGLEETSSGSRSHRERGRGMRGRGRGRPGGLRGVPPRGGGLPRGGGNPRAGITPRGGAVPPRGRGQLRGGTPKAASSPTGMIDRGGFIPNQAKSPRGERSPNSTAPISQPPKPPPRNTPPKPGTPLPKTSNVSHIIKQTGPALNRVSPTSPVQPRMNQIPSAISRNSQSIQGRPRAATLETTTVRPPVAPRSSQTLVPTSVPGDLNSALWRALRSGNETEFKNLLPNSKDFVNSQDVDGDTPLSFVAHNTNIAIAKILLAHNATPSKPTMV